MKHKKLFIGLGIAAAVIVTIELVLYAITGAFGRTAFASLFGNDPELKKTKTEIVWPERGKILDCKGHVIATNRTVWDVHLDCTVLDAPEEEWKTMAADLAKEFEAILGQETGKINIFHGIMRLLKDMLGLCLIITQFCNYYTVMNE